MVHVFKDGRILFSDELLRSGDKGKYISVKSLPFVTTNENQQVYYYADLKEKTVKYNIIDLETHNYEDEEEPQIEPENQ